MKISTSVNYGINNGLSKRDALRVMKQAGYDGIDLDLSAHQFEPEKYLTKAWLDDAVETGRIAKEEGLEVVQCHLPYYPGHLPNPGDGSVKAFCDAWLPLYEHALDACGQVGCKIGVTHPMCERSGREATIEANVIITEKLKPQLKDCNIRLAYENCFIRENRKNIPMYVEEAETICGIVENAGSEYAGACLDTGHANIFRFDISEFARKLGKNLIALHVNSNGGEDHHSVPYMISGWTERMDFFAFSRTLKEIGYQGSYNLEIAGGRFPPEAAKLFYGYTACVARWLADMAN